MPHIISSTCITCGTCLNECPVDAISENEIYLIDPLLCIDCAACVEVCPVDAISEES